MEKDKKILYIVAIIFIELFIGTIFFIMNEPKHEKPIETQPQVMDTEYDVAPIDTTIGMNRPWPVKVINVKPNTNEFIEGEWIVMTENGLTYYTNEITHVGQIAFYLGNNGEMITNYERNKIDPREWR